MSNQWFRFRQFTIQQDRCAMKVGTDGVILGAWSKVEGAAKALDVGTGTGLIALMLAQRSGKLILDAIELEPDAAEQASLNVSNSKFAQQVRIIHGDFRDLAPQGGISYDLITCNPPYFSGSMEPGDRARTVARHSVTLTTTDLLAGSNLLLNHAGRVSIIIPAEQYTLVTGQAESYGFFLCRILWIRPVPDALPRRVCIEFERQRKPLEEKMMVIETAGRHGYSAEYLELTKDFYPWD